MDAGIFGVYLGGFYRLGCLTVCAIAAGRYLGWW
jgi:hypothetical protein